MSPALQINKQSQRTTSPAREFALRTLLRVESKHENPTSLLNQPVAESLSRRDRALTQELVFGVLRYRGRLDFVLSHHSSRPVATMDPTVRMVLRLGLYQLRHLERIPDRAAVDESVRLIRSHARAASGFVNAILRSVCRRPEHPRLPTPEQPMEFLTDTLAQSTWVARRWLDRLGSATAFARAEHSLQRPNTYLSCLGPSEPDEIRNALAIEGVETEPVPEVPGSLKILSGSPVHLLDSDTLVARQVHIQEAGSRLVGQLVEATQGQRVLDACAAPGGKTRSIAARAPAASIVACDRTVARIRLLETVAQLSHRAVIPVVADMRNPPFRTSFDWILFDAPCSSLGTLARNPDIKWRLDESDLSRLAAAQRRGILALEKLLAPGGTLVYATCSTEPEENEEVVEFALRTSPELTVIPVGPSLNQSAQRFSSPEGYLRILPERHGLDGYFAAVLRKSNK